jgi:hypothetical protein
MSSTSATKRGYAPLLFLFETIICQSIGCAAVILLWQLTQRLEVALIIGPLTALGTSLFFGLSSPWQLLNLILIPSGAMSFAIDLPGWVFLLLFAGTLVIYAPAFWTRVPYYPTNSATYLMLLPELPPNTPFTFIDLGCGFGDLLLFLAKHRPEGRYVGVEIGILPCVIGKVRAAIFGGGKVSIRYQSIWRTKLTSYDFVYTFLSPAPMARVWQKVSEEMKPGSKFINNSFSVPAPAHYEVPVKDEKGTVLYIHSM